MNIAAFPKANRDQVSFDQACAWLSRIDRELTNGERAELEAWLSENPDHLTLLIGIADEWDKLDAVSLLVSSIPGVSTRFTGRRPYRKYRSRSRRRYWLRSFPPCCSSHRFRMKKAPPISPHSSIAL